MGACGGKTCPSLIKRIFREEGVPPPQVRRLTQRPVFMEVPLGAFAGVVTGEGPSEGRRPTPSAPLEGGV